MKIQRLALALTAVNLVLLAVIVLNGLPSEALAVTRSDTQTPPSAAEAIVPTLRARALELVDDRGQVRSRFKIEQNGEVVFRLLDQNGTIRVKLGADERGSGLLLLDETTEPAVHMIARRTGRGETEKTTSVTLQGAAGQQRVIKP